MIYPNQQIKTAIVPTVASYYDLPGEYKLDYEAICCFAAIGFFLSDDTYLTNHKSFRPATTYVFDERGSVISARKYFHWHHSPEDIPFKDSYDRFCDLLDKIIDRDTKGRRIMLPISGGLDSRTLAVSVQGRKRDVQAYSYQFDGGPPENSFGKKVAEALGFGYQPFLIREGYLWQVIDHLAAINGCYADFVNPRQMAIWGQVTNGDLFLLGHGGDLFFDTMGVADGMSESEQVDYLFKRLVRPSGLVLGERLWKEWALPGTLREYLIERFCSLLGGVAIENPNARLRAFKTEFYVSRWTAVNLEIFRRQAPISVPFFDDEFCQFICVTPEKHLANRALQIEYIKERAPSVAEIPWQKYYPCNLYNFGKFNSIPTKAVRGFLKGKRILMGLGGRRSDLRNWELQFLGEANERSLSQYLFENRPSWLPSQILRHYLDEFKSNPEREVFPITMLLTLSMFGRQHQLPTERIEMHA